MGGRSPTLWPTLFNRWPCLSITLFINMNSTLEKTKCFSQHPSYIPHGMPPLNVSHSYTPPPPNTHTRTHHYNTFLCKCKLQQLHSIIWNFVQIGLFGLKIIILVPLLLNCEFHLQQLPQWLISLWSLFNPFFDLLLFSPYLILSFSVHPFFLSLNWSKQSKFIPWLNNSSRIFPDENL